MEFSAQIIAELLNGKVEGNPEITVNNVAKIEEGTKGTLSFLANPKYTKYIYTTKASIVIVGNDFVADSKIESTLIRVENPYQAFATLLEFYNSQKGNKTGIEDPVFIHKTAKYGEGLYLGAFAYLGENSKVGTKVKIYSQSYIGNNVSVGDNTIIFPGVKIYDECVIGANCIIHAGVVIGSDGFGFAPKNDNNYQKVPQVGNVVLEDDVEIGANTVIDRATMGSTIIRKGVKLDNLIQIAHNVEIGSNTVIAAQTGVSGSSKIGANCMIAGQVGVAGHLTISDNVKVGAQAGVGRNFKENEIVQGSPAFNIRDFQKSYVIHRKLPELYNKVSSLEKELKLLKEKL